MKDVRTRTPHEQAGKFKEPALPVELDIQSAYEEDIEIEIAYKARITRWRRIPRDGPEEPRSRMRFAIVCITLTMWIAWIVLGAVRLSLSGDIRMLLAAPAFLLIPLGFVLRYYFSTR